MKKEARTLNILKIFSDKGTVRVRFPETGESWKGYGKGTVRVFGTEKKLGALDFQGLRKCGKQDLNLQVRIAHMNLNHARLPIPPFPQKMVGRGGFEPPKRVAADLQSAPFGHSGTYPYGLPS